MYKHLIFVITITGGGHSRYTEIHFVASTGKSFWYCWSLTLFTFSLVRSIEVSSHVFLWKTSTSKSHIQASLSNISLILPRWVSSAASRRLLRISRPFWLTSTAQILDWRRKRHWTTECGECTQVWSRPATRRQVWHTWCLHSLCGRWTS